MNFSQISFVKLKTINKIQIKLLRLFKENLIFKQFFHYKVGEHCHCALMTNMIIKIKQVIRNITYKKVKIIHL